MGHAFRLLTGSKEQYTIRQQEDNSYKCYSQKHPHTGEYEPMVNAPHECGQHLFDCSWPEAGGGGDGQLNPLQLFEHMCAWDDSHYLMCAGTHHGSDEEDRDGIADGHAYTIMRCHAFRAHNGDEVDLVKMRNPWGRGEFKSGKWIDIQMGAGWSHYPEIKKACNPLSGDDGVFWLSKEEFFEYYPTIYLCAHSMKKFVNS